MTAQLVRPMSITPLDNQRVLGNRRKSSTSEAPATRFYDRPRSNTPETARAPSIAASGAHTARDVLSSRLKLGRPLRVMMLGMRGFPDVQGGVEKHTENLALSLTKLNCEVEAITRTTYVPKGTRELGRIRIVRIWNSRMKGVETFLHTFLGVLYAGWRRPDVLHIHGIGPAFFAPLARVLGLKVVVTYHSLNYQHVKWGPFARTILRIGEWAGIAFSHGRIAVSSGLAEQMKASYQKPIYAIPNGLEKPKPVQSTDVLQAFGLTSGRYVISVARIDEAKRQLDLIAAYARIHEPTFKLALVGEADYIGPYARSVSDAAKNTPGVVLLGRQTGNALAELYTHAGIFVLASGHEGQPIAVLEAASYGLQSVLSDIPAHREIAPPGTQYFDVGDAAGLGRHLVQFFSASELARLPDEERDRILGAHDWDAIAHQTLGIYSETQSPPGRPG